MNGYKIFRACDRHTAETAILSKYVTECKYINKLQMRKRMVEFLVKKTDRHP